MQFNCVFFACMRAQFVLFQSLPHLMLLLLLFFPLNNRVGRSKSNRIDHGTIRSLIHSIQAKQLIFDLFTFLPFRQPYQHYFIQIHSMNRVENANFAIATCYLFRAPVRIWHDNERRQVCGYTNCIFYGMNFVCYELRDLRLHCTTQSNRKTFAEPCQCVCIQLEIISIQKNKKAISNHNNNNNNTLSSTIGEKIS